MVKKRPIWSHWLASCFSTTIKIVPAKFLDLDFIFLQFLCFGGCPIRQVGNPPWSEDLHWAQLCAKNFKF